MNNEQLLEELMKYPKDATIALIKHEDNILYEITNVFYSQKDNEIILC